jgi:hypothetical protein
VPARWLTGLDEGDPAHMFFHDARMSGGSKNG